MSCNYADGLSPYHDKGQLGLEEKFDDRHEVKYKAELLARWIQRSKHVVFHTGAGISTSSGIPDFRGPNGVWTLQEKGLKPKSSVEFDKAIPTPTHMAIVRLIEMKKIHYVISQNIDGLHLRSNLGRRHLSELHGNVFTEKCNHCNRQFVRGTAVPTVGQKNLNKPCLASKLNSGRPCRGKLRDTVLDWEHNLPENDLSMADYHSSMADLSVCLGTTLQIVPSGDLPLNTKNRGGKLVIINLQPTKYDSQADLVIHAYVDELMTMVMKQLSLRIPKYNEGMDPTYLARQNNLIDWTITDEQVLKFRKIFEETVGGVATLRVKDSRKRLDGVGEEELLDDDMPLNKVMERRRKAKGDDEDSDIEVIVEKVSPAPKRRIIKVRNTNLNEKPSTQPTKLVLKKVINQYEVVRSANTSGKKAKKETKLDLDMGCESDDDYVIPYTTNFKLNLDNFEKIFQDEDKGDKIYLDSAKDNNPENVSEIDGMTPENVPKTEDDDDEKIEVKAGDVAHDDDKINEPHLEDDKLEKNRPEANNEVVEGCHNVVINRDQLVDKNTAEEDVKRMDDATADSLMDVDTEGNAKKDKDESS